MLLIAMGTAIASIISIVGSYFDRYGNRVHYIGKLWSRVNLFLSGVSVEVRGIEHIKKGQPYIVMSNHQSYYDVWALIAYLPLQLRWVMKLELREIPIFGLGCERVGHIYIDRSDSEKSHKSLEVAGEKIRAGASVVFFPEGTRSPDSSMLPFKKGGFVIALAAGVPILPITVIGGRNILRKGSMRILPGKMQIIIHEPISIEGYTRETKEELMAKVRVVIEKDLR